MFQFDNSTLRELADDALKYGAAQGATAMVAEISENAGLNVTVRRQNVETVEQTRDKSFSVTAYIGDRRGNASSADFSMASIRETVDAALNIARFTAPDKFAGLPAKSDLARKVPDLDLYHPWDLSTEQAIEIATEAEQAALGLSAEIGNTDGASVSTGIGQFVLANSLGFNNGYPYSRHSLSCVPIAVRGDDMQRDYWYAVDCDPTRLADATAIGDYAGRRALARLGSRRLPTQRAPVLFEAPIAAGLLGHVTQAASGSALYRGSSFLEGALNKPLFAKHISISEEPHLKRNLGGAPFDGEGVKTRSRKVVDAGVLKGYFLSSYSARKLKMKTTGNAGGSHLLSLESKKTKPGDDLPAMLRKLDRGLFVTELMGMGVSYVTGDYSRGAAGYWVENGEIQYPVEEITIAGNLKDMFKNVQAVGSDVMQRGGKKTGSVLLGEMSIAGT
ncbi:MAG: metalloprotease PmbA [Burkholderiaceae bacterium]